MKRECMSMWKSEEWVVRLELNCRGCHRLGGKSKFIKDSNFKLTWPNMHPTLTLTPLQPMESPHDICMHAWNNCWLLDEKQILESMSRRELSDQPYTLERLERIHFRWGFDAQFLVPGFHELFFLQVYLCFILIFKLVGFMNRHMIIALLIHMCSWGLIYF